VSRLQATIEDQSPSPSTQHSWQARYQFPIVIGVLWALLTVTIWGAWPAVTRLSVTQTMTPQDLVALRYAIGGLILLPVLIQQADHMPRRGWSEGVVLAVCQGAPLALLVTIGTQFAPASHMGALSPGPLALFAALLGVLFYNERLSVSRLLGLALILGGTLLMAGVSLSIFADDTWKGDLLFISAGFMGSIYAVRMRHSGLTAMQGAALISVYSMAFYLPLYVWLWLGAARLAQAPIGELLFQAFYQGVLMGAVALFSLSRAIVLLGAARAAAFISLVPVLGTLLGYAILGEIPSASESIAVVAISLGVLLAAGTFQRAPQR
jgi:drug/metabolite transporter (DMT)-like permease